MNRCGPATTTRPASAGTFGSDSLMVSGSTLAVSDEPAGGSPIGQPTGAVLAAGHLFTPLALALPFLVGTVADHAGTLAALALLVAQPAGLVVLVAATRVRSHR